MSNTFFSAYFRDIGFSPIQNNFIQNEFNRTLIALNKESTGITPLITYDNFKKVHYKYYANINQQ